MRRALVLSSLLFLFSGCFPVKPSVEGQKGAYRPYDQVSILERQAYNAVFNWSYERLVYYVEKTLPEIPETLGFIVEVKAEGRKKNFDQLSRASYERAWQLLEVDPIPVPSEDIALWNEGNISDLFKNSPKVLFTLQFSQEDTAMAYVRFWLLSYQNYNYICHLKKSGGVWTLSEAVEQNP